VLKLLNLNVDSYVYIGQIFTFLMAFLAVPSAMFLDRFGIRATILTAACFFTLGGIFQSLLYFTQLPGWPQNKMYFYIITRVLTTESFALFFLLPLKVSESWFSESERTTAWMMMDLQSQLGVCLVSFLYPRLIVGTGDFQILSYVTIVSVISTLVTCIALVTKSEPPNPPSRRAASKDIAPFVVSLKRVLKQRDILLHMIHHSVLVTVLMTLGGVLQNVLSSIGYSQIFAGNYMLINALISIIMSMIMSCFVHKISNATLACKLSSLLQSAQFVGLLMVIYSASSGWLIVGMSIVLTLLRSFTVPNFNNMTAHLACGVVSQPTMVGLSLAITPVIMTTVQVTFAYLIEIHDKTNDYHNSLLFLMGVSIANEAVYQIFFQGKSSNPADDIEPVIEDGADHL
jgi:MFS family permease